MKIDKAKLVAFAHGELQGEEAREVERHLAADKDSAAYVQEVRALAARARAELGAEPLPRGDGAQKILGEIARRRKANRPSERQLWLQGAMVALVVGLVFAVAPLREKFRGALFGSMNSATNQAAQDPEDPRPVGPKPKEDVRVAAGDFDELLARKVVPGGTAHCEGGFPVLTSIDQRHERRGAEAPYSLTYLLRESGASLFLELGSNPQPLVKEEGTVELGRGAAGTLFQRTEGELALTWFVVPERNALPFCWLKLNLEGKLGDSAKKIAAESLEAFGRKLAEGLRVK